MLVGELRDCLTLRVNLSRAMVRVGRSNDAMSPRVVSRLSVVHL